MRPYPIDMARGRPSLGNKATVVRLPEAMLQRIDRLSGNKRRAAFIREAIENELKRRETDP